VWGLGLAVFVQQMGWRPFDPLLVYGLPAAAALLSALWGRRGRRRVGPLALIALATIPIFAQEGGCDVRVSGDVAEERSLVGTSTGDPVIVVRDFEELVFVIEVDGAGDGDVWVEVGGFRIPVASGFVEGGLQKVVTPNDLGPLASPGLYHVGGTVHGLCTGGGYVRIEGRPWDNPYGIGGMGLFGLGLFGTWFAGRRPRRMPTPPESEPPPEPAPVPPPLPIAPSYRPARIRAWLFDEATGAGLTRFVAGHSHRIEARLEAAPPEWAKAARLAGAPPRDVTVVLVEPHLLPAPEVAHVRQAGTAASGPAAFHLDVPEDATSVDARLIALQGNRILHSVRLPDEVVEGVAGGTAPSAADVAAIETTVTALPVGPEAGTVDAALLANHHDGTARATAVSDEEAAVVELGAADVAEAVDKIRSRLGEIVARPGDFATLGDPGSVELLVFLAHHGRLLRNVLTGDFLAGRLAEAGRIQVVSATPDAYLPLEFAYDFPAPAEDAALCPGAADALRSPDPATPCRSPHSERTVCPTGFWGLSRIIERHAHQPGDSLPGGFLLRSAPIADRRRLAPGSILLAASERVDAVDPGTTEHLSGRLRSAGDADRVDGWQAWKDKVAAGPALTMLLAHTVYSDTLETYGLEIGHADRCWAGDIDDRFVPPEERPVITALLGCETAAAGRVSYERFPGLFRRAGAEVVFATLTEVLGRHAAPLAGALAEEIADAWRRGPVAAGEVLLRLRRRSLAEGTPAVLAIVAYGDADWLLGGDA
jgi:hypothetical protein